MNHWYTAVPLLGPGGLFVLVASTLDARTLYCVIVLSFLLSSIALLLNMEDFQNLSCAPFLKRRDQSLLMRGEIVSE